MLGLYTGNIDEDEIYNMSYCFYNDVLKEIFLMLNYQATANLLANPFAGEEGIEIVNQTNPSAYKETSESRRLTMGDLINSPLMNGQ